jgi:hypothetical protein
LLPAYCNKSKNIIRSATLMLLNNNNNNKWLESIGMNESSAIKNTVAKFIII